MLPGLDVVFSNIHVKNSLSRRLGMAYLVAATAGDQPRSLRDMSVVADHACKLALNGDTLKKFIDAITSSIDDRLDPMPFAELETLGAIHLGDTPSPFILNPKVLTPDDWQTFRAMDYAGIMPLPVTIALGNAMAAALFEEKKACHLAEQTPAARRPIKDNHLRLSELCVAFLAAVVNPLEGRKLRGQMSPMTPEFVTSVNPNAAKFGAIIQMHNDMTDLVKDMQDEIDTGMAAPNAVIADVAVVQGLPEYKGFLIAHGADLPAGRHLQTGVFPPVVGKCWNAMRSEAIAEARKITSPTATEGLIRMMQTLPGPFVPRRLG